MTEETMNDRVHAMHVLEVLKEARAFRAAPLNEEDTIAATTALLEAVDKLSAFEAKAKSRDVPLKPLTPEYVGDMVGTLRRAESNPDERPWPPRSND